MTDGRKTSVFDNSEFANGFIMFYDSAEFEKYMKPFLAELVEQHRTALESATDAKDWQSRLKAVRHIQFKGEVLKAQKQELADEVSRRHGVGGE